MRWCWNILHKHPGGRWTRYTLRTASNQWSIYASCTKTNMLSIFHASAVLSNNSLDNQKQITHRMAAVLQVNVWGAFMAHMFEVCWETRSSNYISVWVHCLVGTVKAKQKKKKKMKQIQKNNCCITSIRGKKISQEHLKYIGTYAHFCGQSWLIPQWQFHHPLFQWMQGFFLS